MGNNCVKEPIGNELKQYILFVYGNRISGGIKYVRCRLLKPSLSKRIVSGEKPAWSVLSMASDDEDLKVISQHFRYVVDYSSIAVIKGFSKGF